MINIAPIILFAYNRPAHTKRTVEALQKNDLAIQSDLYIYSDQAIDSKDVTAVEAVRKYVKTIRGFNRITYVYHAYNKGLAKSIIDGVSEVLQNYEKVIVLEDDLETSPTFLRYMNQALEFYSPEQVWSIGGYSPRIQIPQDYKYDTYLAYRNCSWGWATWKQNWEKTDWEVSDFNDFFKDQNQRTNFERGGNDLSMMLLKQQKRIIQSWSIRFNYAAYKNNLPSVYPTQSYIKNLGVDGSGTNMKKSSKYDSVLNVSKHVDFLFVPDHKFESSITDRFKKFYNTSLYRSVINWFKTQQAVRIIQRNLH
ncbi:glycosyltransferase [Saccharicrinis fermentans]|uniref:Glycosyltransferase 2-like domain-containing protein n=1 Tax=Saccharicrinis fermentans DSM 9555 = JCM 21142 TaxID=869213 RepID=W7YBF8_9BACT|nr:glycosyltransferase [Saccharicrinis fermentans]GAF01756.1 hypothetical protein JCM21142_372 [Saccharicrinis fermentans DSM 9555 = JCM 21142]